LSGSGRKQKARRAGRRSVGGGGVERRGDPAARQQRQLAAAERRRHALRHAHVVVEADPLRHQPRLVASVAVDDRRAVDRLADRDPVQRHPAAAAAAAGTLLLNQSINQSTPTAIYSLGQGLRIFTINQELPK